MPHPGARRAFGGVMLGCSLLAPTLAAQAPDPPAPDAQRPPPFLLDGLAWSPAPSPTTGPGSLTTSPRPLFGVDVTLTCPSCGGDLSTPPRNPNAPWTVRGGWGVAGGAGAFSASLVGQRGVRAPLYLQGPIDAAARTTPSSWATLADTRTSWDVVLRGERTVHRFRGGGTVALFGEWFVPLGATGAVSTADVPPLSQSAFIVGVRIRW